MLAFEIYEQIIAIVSISKYDPGLFYNMEDRNFVGFKIQKRSHRPIIWNNWHIGSHFLKHSLVQVQKSIRTKKIE